MELHALCHHKYSQEDESLANMTPELVLEFVLAAALDANTEHLN